jgi:hypothetical protein
VTMKKFNDIVTWWDRSSPGMSSAFGFTGVFTFKEKIKSQLKLVYPAKSAERQTCGKQTTQIFLQQIPVTCAAI